MFKWFAAFLLVVSVCFAETATMATGVSLHTSGNLGYKSQVVPGGFAYFLRPIGSRWALRQTADVSRDNKIQVDGLHLSSRTSLDFMVNRHFSLMAASLISQTRNELYSKRSVSPAFGARVVLPMQMGTIFGYHSPVDLTSENKVRSTVGGWEVVARMTRKLGMFFQVEGGRVAYHQPWVAQPYNSSGWYMTMRVGPAWSIGRQH
jgi:hypothetical protein